MVLDIEIRRSGPFEKSVEFQNAPNGIVGLETAFGLSYTHLVKKGVIELPRLIELLSTNPARILGIEGGTLGIGKPADITVLDLETPWTIECQAFFSKSKNSPYQGWEVYGRPHFVFVDGAPIYPDEVTFAAAGEPAPVR